MEDCKQKFPIMWHFNVLPLSQYCHSQYTATKWGEQVVALYCTTLFMWWYKDELWLDGLKINHLKTQTMHVCNTKIKQKGHQFMFTLLLQYTTYNAVIFTFISLFQSHSSNTQGLCYQMPISCFIWNFCVQTVIHLQQYTPTPFFMPQYLERQSNQPQTRDGKSYTTEAHTI